MIQAGQPRDLITSPPADLQQTLYVCYEKQNIWKKIQSKQKPQPAKKQAELPKQHALKKSSWSGGNYLCITVSCNTIYLVPLFCQLSSNHHNLPISAKKNLEKKKKFQEIFSHGWTYTLLLLIKLKKVKKFAKVRNEEKVMSPQPRKNLQQRKKNFIWKISYDLLHSIAQWVKMN